MNRNQKPDKRSNRNPFCRSCRMPMKKKGATKPGEARFRCQKCGSEK